MWMVIVFLLLVPDVWSGQGWATTTSPCPTVFNYEYENDLWIGVVAVTVPSDGVLRTNRTYKLRVTMTVAAYLPSGQYAGKIDLRESKESVVSRLQKGGSVTIFYRVYFPLQNPLPHATSVEMNGRELCRMQQSADQLEMPRTTLTLSHTLYVYALMAPYLSQSGTRVKAPEQVTDSADPLSKPSLLHQSTLQSTLGHQTTPPFIDNTKSPVVIQQTTKAPLPQPSKTPSGWYQTTTTPAAPTSQVVAADDAECGTVVQSVHLVQNGEAAQNWPWLTAIYKKTQIGLDFHCGGSLVSLTHVVTAAHCVQMKIGEARPVAADSLLLILGKRNLRQWTEGHSQSRDVKDVILHPSLDVDLAVLVLAIPATFTRSVRPICLWSSRRGYNGTSGTVVGWGRDENGNRITDEPRQVTMPLVSQEECLRSHRDFYYLTSENTFCAGGRDGTGPCSGDSGSGMYVSKRSSGQRWMLKGVVSRALLDETTRQCDLRHFVVFTDTGKLAPWIRQITKTF